MMAAGTMVSRLTGFVRSAMIVSALGLALLGESFQIAYQLPTMIYILTVGGGLNSVFVPQLVRSMKDDEDGGEAYANRLLTLVMVALAALTALAWLAAPLLVSALSVSVANDPAANDVAVTFTRFFLPSIFFMGVHVVMGQILNARGRFGAMMWTPVLNNIVIIVTLGTFIWVYGTAADSKMKVTNIPPEGLRLLGVGVLLGLVVQALAMVPYLRETGFRIRPRFDWKGHGLGKAAMLAKWTILFVLANQAGALVVTQLATASVKGTNIAGTGFSAYSNAQLIWGLPQAIITVSLMAALLPRISRSAAEDDGGAVRDDISQGLRTTAVAIVPIAFGFLSLGIPMCTLIFGSSGIDASTNMGYMLMAFGLGLIPYSVQYVVLRAFYAYEDTRTPSTTRSSWPRATRSPRRSATSCFRPAGPWWAWPPRTASPTSSVWVSRGAGCATGWAGTWTAPGCCGPTPGCASPPFPPRCSAARPATASFRRSVRAFWARSRRCWPVGPYCSECSSWPPAGCGSRKSTHWSVWCADALDAEARGRRTTIVRHRVSCIAADCGHNWSRRRTARDGSRPARMGWGGRERRWPNGAQLPSTWQTTAANNR
ncbi:hypothetical protein SHKM778_93820 [Streptomyces sp. KM77-8]|uniref:Murein biosynthesis integral membrane protein MurJ n=1 Tax=Streptomyces haneummycinicus TaxID=3074435 RepID=A0AAT9I0F2_9ACTN